MEHGRCRGVGQNVNYTSCSGIAIGRVATPAVQVLPVYQELEKADRLDRIVDGRIVIRSERLHLVQNLAVILQLEASLQAQGSCGEFKAAFMQSKPSMLDMRQPTGGLPSLEPDQLVEVVSGAYGLIKIGGPCHWRQTLKYFIVACDRC